MNRDTGFRARGVAVRSSHSVRWRFRVAGYLRSETLLPALIAVLSGILFWLVWIYGNSLRDPRYLDGWVLAGGMCLQVGFHVATKVGRLSPKAVSRWRGVHVALGLFLIAAFLSHSNVSLPDSGFEWALWAGFVLVTLSGIFGATLAWSSKAGNRIEQNIDLDRLEIRRRALAREVDAAVAKPSPAAAASTILPPLPYDAWILDLHTNHLRDFFQGPRNAAAHVVCSPRPLERLTDEIDNLSRFVDENAQGKLAVLRHLVVEKDHLDFARVRHALTKGWLFVHVPATYALIVLSVLHVVVAYAFTSGAW